MLYKHHKLCFVVLKVRLVLSEVVPKLRCMRTSIWREPRSHWQSRSRTPGMTWGPKASTIRKQKAKQQPRGAAGRVGKPAATGTGRGGRRTPTTQSDDDEPDEEEDENEGEEEDEEAESRASSPERELQLRREQSARRLSSRPAR